MTRPTFQGARFIIRTSDQHVLRQFLPESLRADFDTSARRYTGKRPALLGDPSNLECGLSWGAEHKQETIVVHAIDPNLCLTYEQIRELEDHLETRNYPEILFFPWCQPGDTLTHNIIPHNHARSQPWDSGLVGPEGVYP